jgi:beta-galactosidase
MTSRKDAAHTTLTSILFILSTFMPAALHAFAPPASNRVIENQNADWKFIKQDVAGAQAVSVNDNGWTSLTLPHTWNNLDGQDGGSNYYRGVGWYRKHFTINASYSGRSLFLRFDGANQVADVYLNGTLLGEHKGGFAAFCFDITAGALVGGDNVLAVKVTNASNNDIPPLTADFTFFGGIYRDVNLLVTDKLAVTPLDYASPGVYCRTPSVSAASASVRVVSKVRNAGAASKITTVLTTIADASGATIATANSSQTVATGATVDFVQPVTIQNPHLWNGLSDPYLYNVYVQVLDGSTVTDVVKQPLGLRFFRVDPNTGFYLNNTYKDLHGVNCHQDRLNMGWAIGPAQHLEDFNLIREMGCNAIRLSHYQHAEYFYDLCDSAGMAVWAEIPLVNRVTISDSFNANAQQQMTELIRQNYNHPSIFFWGIGNEITGSPDPNPILDALHKLIHVEDSTRLSTYASNTKNDTNTTNALNWHSDVNCFNQYFGWYSDNGPLSAFPHWSDRMHAVYASKCLGMSEYGGGGCITQHAENPPQPDPYGSPHPEEYQNFVHESYWSALKTRNFFWCKFIWCMFDFAVDSRNEGDTPGRNDKGMVTYDRKTKKDCFYFYKANWTTDPVVYITSRRFTPRPFATVEVKVYSNTDSVQLYINGALIGAIAANGTDIFKWTSQKLSQGKNTIKSIGYKNGAASIDSCAWVYGTVGAIGNQLPQSGFEKHSSELIQNGYLVLPEYAAGNRVVRILTPSGRVNASAHRCDGKSFKIPLFDLPKGMFLLELSGGAHTLIKRFYVQK